MARLGETSAHKRSTSLSRGVRRSSWASTALRLASSVAIVRGVISILPRATSRIAATTSEAARDLWMKALAPDWTAANLADSVSSRVRKIILAAGRMLRIPGAAARPASVGQREVQEHDFGIQCGRRLRALGDRADAAHHGHVVLAVDQRGQTLRDDAVVLDDQDASRLRVAIASRTIGELGGVLG